MDLRERAAGCLLCGAVGDALGFAVEFIPLSEILRRYGENGIADFGDGVARISDDTQMTLFSAEAMIAHLRGEGDVTACAAKSYAAWLQTQNSGAPKEGASGLARDVRLYSRRAPGITCLTALESGVVGTLSDPINKSKGCGGVMRAAPAGLAVTGLKGGADEAAMAGAQLAAVTHGHELGYIPAAQLAYIVALAVEGESLPYAVEKSRVAMKRLFPHAVHLSEADRLTEKAVDLAMSDVGDRDAVAALGEGWVGEEALAIAVYCALRHGEDIGAALAAAVNHSGDSDSTGAVTGNILGAFFGERAVPRRFTERLELADLLKESAVALADEAERARGTV